MRCLKSRLLELKRRLKTGGEERMMLKSIVGEHAYFAITNVAPF